MEEPRKDLLDEKRGSGVDPIPEPDSRKADAEGSTAAVDDAVSGMMDKLEESFFGKPEERSDSGRKTK
ncbi:hypothetical protein F4V43_03345 [Paenibacillus spiritus]|uniref:Uncharacterized protein n=1 Tax=Paenibacillus spiritus TaxID=2496557 RepID=A0A5J5GH45_9BACL|nr:MULTISPECIES: hypothetical protein [Paenibacillus]KAA9007539.1 hypothetical protein F4V43_03345 [Paenibacillus spiritus]